MAGALGWFTIINFLWNTKSDWSNQSILNIAKPFMYQVVYIPALRMERSLPFGTPTLPWDYWISASVLNVHVTSTAHSKTFLGKLFLWRIRNFVLRLLPETVILSSQVLRELILPQPNMGADPIITSATVQHGCCQSNHGGNIQCQ